MLGLKLNHVSKKLPDRKYWLLNLYSRDRLNISGDRHGFWPDVDGSRSICIHVAVKKLTPLSDMVNS